MLNATLVSLLFGGLLISITVGADSDLEALCLDKPIELRKVSQVRGLIRENKQNPLAACSNCQNSLQDLDDILSSVETGKTCDLVLVDKIRKYQQDHLAQDGELAPVALRQFFLALGFQISAECKIVMINNFETDIARLISDSDYEIFNLLERSGANALGGDSKVNDYDDIILAKEFYSGIDNVEPMKLLIKVKTGDMVKKLIGECRRKFKPIYDKLIMPLIELSNLGYNYQGELLDRELAELRQNELIQRWYNILQTCEAFEALSIFEDPSDPSIGRKAILISRAEADQLTPVDSALDSTEPTINYEPPISHNSDELWILSKQELDKLISKRRASATEADRIRGKIFRKLLNRVKGAFKSGDLISSVKSGMSDLKPFTDGDDLIRAIDGAVSEESASNIDSAVSGGHRARKPVAKALNTYNIPPKPTFIQKVENGSKTSTWLWDSSIGRLSPSRKHIFLWTLAAACIILIVIASLSLSG